MNAPLDLVSAGFFDATRPESLMLSDEMRFKLMRLLQANPRLSQRDVARELDISLGRVNYCLKALVDRGWIKASRFRNSRNKAAYMYLLTPRGIEAKAGLTVRFLKDKMREYENLRAEIEEVRREAGESGSAPGDQT
jgi:EPS-associated MarR family transcriptional regulator